MSEDVSITGKLVPVDLGSLTLEEKALELISYDDRDSIRHFNSALEYLTVEMDYYFDKASETLYEIVEKEKMGDEDFIDLTLNEDGSINFRTRFYNGGADLHEMLDDGFDELER